MSIPYRARQNLQRALLTILALVFFFILALLCWLLWLNRFVVYDRDGARLDFSLSGQYAPGQTPVEPQPLPPIILHDKEEDVDDPAIPGDRPLQQLAGYYVTLEQLTDPEGFAHLRERLAALPENSTVMLELKDNGSFTYYSSDVAPEKPDYDIARMDQLLKELKAQGHYVIAQIPAFQERDYILADERGRFSHGLEHTRGGSLWWDDANRCYWLNPASDGAMAYLIQMVTELRSLGFDEVCFRDFRFPDTDQVKFEGDRLEALTKAAEVLVKTCATERFCVSFTRPSADLTLPEGRTRLYLTGINAADADTEAVNSGLADPTAQVVFLTETSDTRYEVFSVLRPLDTAH